MKNINKSLLLVCTALVVLVLGSCNAIADTSNLSQPPDPVWLNLEPSAINFDEKGVGTATLVLDFDKEIAGLTDDLSASALAEIFTFKYEDTGGTVPTIKPLTIKKGESVVGIYTLTVTGIPADAGRIILVSIAKPTLTPATRIWTLTGNLASYTTFVYNETCYTPSEKNIYSGRGAADGKLRAIPGGDESGYDPSQDETVNLADFPVWAAGTMTADTRLALLCGGGGSFTIKGKLYQTKYIHEIKWSSDVAGASTIGDDFLMKFYGLASLDLSSFSNLASIGDKFLENCTSLTSLDLSPLSQLTSIGAFFLNVCSMTTVDMGAISLEVFGEDYEGSFDIKNACQVKVADDTEAWDDFFEEASDTVSFVSSWQEIN